MATKRPLIGITSDLIERSPGRWSAAVGQAYCERVAEAGGVPVVLPPVASLVQEHAAACDAFVFTGGNDPDLSRWGIKNHPEATLMVPARQDYELRLLEVLKQDYPRKPVLGICLGMQMMCLEAGGTLHQHLPDIVVTAQQHRNSDHAVKAVATIEEGCPAWLAEGGVGNSNHHQGVSNPGPGMRILATSDDGVIEAVVDHSRPFYVGVQWHPERTADDKLGKDVFRALVAAVK